MKPLPFLYPAAGTPAVRNPGRPAVIVPIQAVGADELSAQCPAAGATGVVDVIEWRIDPLLAQSVSSAIGGHSPAETSFSRPTARAEEVPRLLPHVAGAGLPVLLTVRTAFEGGLVEITENDYADLVRRLIADVAGGIGVPAALDVEIDRAESRALIAEAQAAGVPVVASHHNFAATDSHADLRATFRRMDEAGADVAKVAMMPQAPTDVLRLLDATAEAAATSSRPVLGISMGTLGRTSRIMGADFGSCASFAQIGAESAPGQIDAARLAEILDRVSG